MSLYLLHLYPLPAIIPIPLLRFIYEYLISAITANCSQPQEFGYPYPTLYQIELLVNLSWLGIYVQFWLLP